MCRKVPYNESVLKWLQFRLINSAVNAIQTDHNNGIFCKLTY